VHAHGHHLASSLQTATTLTTQMKSVGKAMAIGRTFKESLQKCLRSLEVRGAAFMPLHLTHTSTGRNSPTPHDFAR